jgi:3-methylcrotonyl-CoA carboxylase alpha subunit
MAFVLTLDGRTHEVTIVRRRPHLVLSIDGREHEVDRLADVGDGRHLLGVAGHRVAFARAGSSDRQIVRLGGRTFEVALVDPFSRDGGAGGGQDAVKAPMPGAVVAVHKEPGDRVARGEPVLTIESMKLQTVLSAPRDGVIATIVRAAGESFEKDEIVATLEPEEA